MQSEGKEEQVRQLSEQGVHVLFRETVMAGGQDETQALP